MKKISKKLNVTEYCLRNNLHRQPNKTALILVNKIGDEKKYTFSEIFQDVSKLTAGLKSLNLPKHAVVTIRSPVTYDFLILFLAAIAADLVPISTLIATTEEELNFILKDSNSRIVFQLGEYKLNLNLPTQCREITDVEYQKLKNFNAKDIEPTTVTEDPVYIFYTSGSTGKPKGVLHAQRTIFGREVARKYWLGLSSNDIVMHTDNICWTYSMLTGFLDPLAAGATTVIFIGYNKSIEDEVPAETWLKLIDYYHVTVLTSSPGVYSAILNVKNLSNYSLSSIRIAGSAGSLLPESIQNRWKAYFHKPIFSALGMTELSTFISNSEGFPPRSNKIGKIQPGRRVDILPIDGNCEPVPVNTQGMLAIHKSEPGLMLGYVGELQKDRKYYRGDWFLTQDLVSKDEEGYITYYGRGDNILKVSDGYRVSPIEIETLLLNLTEIKDAACDAIYDEKSQLNVLVAYVVADRPGKDLEQKIHDHLSKHLTAYKIPRHVYFVQILPRNKRGKLLRHKLKGLSKE